MATVPIYFGFEVNDSSAIDTRFTFPEAENLAKTGRLDMPQAAAYEGLISYQEDNNKVYVLTDATDVSDSDNWTEIGSVVFGDKAGNVATWAEGGYSGTDTIPPALLPHLNLTDVKTFTELSDRDAFVGEAGPPDTRWHTGDFAVVTADTVDSDNDGFYVYTGTDRTEAVTTAADYTKVDIASTYVETPLDTLRNANNVVIGTNTSSTTALLLPATENYAGVTSKAQFDKYNAPHIPNISSTAVDVYKGQIVHDTTGGEYYIRVGDDVPNVTLSNASFSDTALWKQIYINETDTALGNYVVIAADAVLMLVRADQAFLINDEWYSNTGAVDIYVDEDGYKLSNTDDDEVYKAIADNAALVELSGDQLPAQASNANKFLQTDGSTATWQDAVVDRDDTLTATGTQRLVREETFVADNPNSFKWVAEDNFELPTQSAVTGGSYLRANGSDNGEWARLFHDARTLVADDSSTDLTVAANEILIVSDNLWYLQNRTGENPDNEPVNYEYVFDSNGDPIALESITDSPWTKINQATDGTNQVVQFAVGTVVDQHDIVYKSPTEWYYRSATGTETLASDSNFPTAQYEQIGNGIVTKTLQNLDDDALASTTAIHPGEVVYINGVEWYVNVSGDTINAILGGDSPTDLSVIANWRRLGSDTTSTLVIASGDLSISIPSGQTVRMEALSTSESPALFRNVSTVAQNVTGNTALSVFEGVNWDIVNSEYDSNFGTRIDDVKIGGSGTTTIDGAVAVTADLTVGTTLDVTGATTLSSGTVADAPHDGTDLVNLAYVGTQHKSLSNLIDNNRTHLGGYLLDGGLNNSDYHPTNVQSFTFNNQGIYWEATTANDVNFDTAIAVAADLNTASTDILSAGDTVTIEFQVDGIAKSVVITGVAQDGDDVTRGAYDPVIGIGGDKFNGIGLAIIHSVEGSTVTYFDDLHLPGTPVTTLAPVDPVQDVYVTAIRYGNLNYDPNVDKDGVVYSAEAYTVTEGVGLDLAGQILKIDSAGKWNLGREAISLYDATEVYTDNDTILFTDNKIYFWDNADSDSTAGTSPSSDTNSWTEITTAGGGGLDLWTAIAFTDGDVVWYLDADDDTNAANYKIYVWQDADNDSEGTDVPGGDNAWTELSAGSGSGNGDSIVKYDDGDSVTYTENDIVWYTDDKIYVWTDSDNDATSTSLPGGENSWDELSPAGAAVLEIKQLSASPQTIEAGEVAYVSPTEWYLNDGGQALSVTSTNAGTDYDDFFRLGQPSLLSLKANGGNIVGEGASTIDFIGGDAITVTDGDEDGLQLVTVNAIPSTQREEVRFHFTEESSYTNIYGVDGDNILRVGFPGDADLEEDTTFRTTLTISDVETVFDATVAVTDDDNPAAGDDTIEAIGEAMVADTDWTWNGSIQNFDNTTISAIPADATWDNYWRDQTDREIIFMTWQQQGLGQFTIDLEEDSNDILDADQRVWRIQLFDSDTDEGGSIVFRQGYTSNSQYFYGSFGTDLDDFVAFDEWFGTNYDPQFGDDYNTAVSQVIFLNAEDYTPPGLEGVADANMATIAFCLTGDPDGPTKLSEGMGVRDMTLETGGGNGDFRVHFTSHLSGVRYQTGASSVTEPIGFGADAKTYQYETSRLGTNWSTLGKRNSKFIDIDLASDAVISIDDWRIVNSPATNDSLGGGTYEKATPTPIKVQTQVSITGQDGEVVDGYPKLYHTLDKVNSPNIDTVISDIVTAWQTTGYTVERIGTSNSINILRTIEGFEDSRGWSISIDNNPDGDDLPMNLTGNIALDDTYMAEGPDPDNDGEYIDFDGKDVVFDGYNNYVIANPDNDLPISDDPLTRLQIFGINYDIDTLSANDANTFTEVQTFDANIISTTNVIAEGNIIVDDQAATSDGTIASKALLFRQPNSSSNPITFASIYSQAVENSQASDEEGALKFYVADGVNHGTKSGTNALTLGHDVASFGALNTFGNLAAWIAAYELNTASFKVNDLHRYSVGNYGIEDNILLNNATTTDNTYTITEKEPIFNTIVQSAWKVTETTNSTDVTTLLDYRVEYEDDATDAFGTFVVSPRKQDRDDASNNVAWDTFKVSPGKVEVFGDPNLDTDGKVEMNIESGNNWMLTFSEIIVSGSSDIANDEGTTSNDGTDTTARAYTAYYYLDSDTYYRVEAAASDSDTPGSTNPWWHTTIDEGGDNEQHVYYTEQIWTTSNNDTREIVANRL